MHTHSPHRRPRTAFGTPVAAATSSRQSTLSFQSPPPDASDISRVSSGEDAVSPPSSSGSSSCSTSRSSTAKSDVYAMKTDEHPPPSPQMHGEEFPLASSAPSREMSKGSAQSFDPTNMYLAASRKQRGDENKHYHSIGPAADDFGSRSSQAPLTDLSTYSFLNHAAKRQYQEEMQKKQRWLEKEHMWKQHVNNLRKYREPELDTKRDSVIQHRLFNLRVRQLKKEDDRCRTSMTVIRESQTGRTSAEPRPRKQPNGQGPPPSPNGITLSDVDAYLFQHVDMMIPQQLTWIGQSGDRGRSSVAPIMSRSERRSEEGSTFIMQPSPDKRRPPSSTANGGPVNRTDPRIDNWFKQAKQQMQTQSFGN